MRIASFLIASTLLGNVVWAQHGVERDNGWYPDYIQLGFGGVVSDKAEDVPGGTIDFDIGYDVALALGWVMPLSERFDINFEFETYYQYFTVDEEDLLAIPSAVNDDASALAFFINVLPQWYFTPQFSVFGGAGFGWAKDVSYDAWDSGNLNQVDDDGYAVQGRLGFDYNLGGNYDFLLGYRYVLIEPVDVENTITNQTDEIDVGQHVFELGFRWGL